MEVPLWHSPLVSCPMAREGEREGGKGGGGFLCLWHSPTVNCPTSQLRQAGCSKQAVVSSPIPLGEVHADFITFFL